jgi:hypothetical protein
MALHRCRTGMVEPASDCVPVSGNLRLREPARRGNSSSESRLSDLTATMTP